MPQMPISNGDKMQEPQQSTLSPIMTPESSPRSSPPPSPESGIGLAKQDRMDLDDLLFHVERQMQEKDNGETVPEIVDGLRIEEEILAESVQKISDEGEKDQMKSKAISTTQTEHFRPNDQADAAIIDIDGQARAPLLTDALLKTSHEDF